jgi:hypothetical protein
MGELNTMTASDIITKFETQVDDTSELSSTQELDLLNKVYQQVCNDRPWEFLKTSATGTLSTSVPYVSLPADFGYITENNQSTFNNDDVRNNAAPKVVWVGSNYRPYQVVNWSDRRQYLNHDGYCYVDIPNARLIFTLQPTTADTYEFDYIKVATALSLSDTPLVPVRFQDMLYHGMAVDNDIILKFPKAQSYAEENQAKYDGYVRSMGYWNSNLIIN